MGITRKHRNLCLPQVAPSRLHGTERRGMEAPNRPIPQPITPEARPFCSSRRIGWIQASGRGKLYSFEIAYQNFNPAYKIKPPYIFAMIELDEGPHMMSNLINIDPDPKIVKCDMPVEVVFEKLTDEVTIPLFQPAK
jgi:hypothetical protein